MRIELTYKGFADLSLTTWVPRRLRLYCVLKLLPNEVYTTGESAGKRKQKLVMLAPKNDQYRSWADVESIMQRVLGEVNTGQEVVTADTSLTDFIEKQYLPWVDQNKSAATANDYRRKWENS